MRRGDLAGPFRALAELFEETANELFTPDCAAQFAVKARTSRELRMVYMPGVAKPAMA